MKKINVVIIIMLFFNSVLIMFPVSVVKAVSTPQITTLSASNVLNTSARMNAFVVNDGDEQCNVTFYYGDDRDNMTTEKMTVTEGTDFVYNTHWIAQTITIGAVGDNQEFWMNKTGVVLDKYGSIADTVHLRITNVTTDGKPGSTEYAHANYPTSGLATYPSLAWYNITWNTTIHMMKNTEYAIVVNLTGGDSSNFVGFGVKTITNPYSGGSRVTSVNSGTTWTISYPTWDCNFILYQTNHTWDNNMILPESYEINDYPFLNWSGISPGTKYYYKSYINNSLYSNIGDVVSFLTYPTIPKDISISINEDVTELTISWNIGEGASSTVIVRKFGSYSTSVIDGTIIYNSSGSSNITEYQGDNYFYTLYSFANGIFSSGVNAEIGGLIVNCFNEETNEPIEFDIEVYNKDGSQYFKSTNNTNSYQINVSVLPIGNNIKIVVSESQNLSSKSETFTGYPLDENETITYVVLNQIPKSKSTTNVTCINENDGSKSFPPFTIEDDILSILPNDADVFTEIIVNYTHYEYASRTYYKDLSEGGLYFLNAYLPPSDDKQLYLLTVIDQYSEPVENAFITVKRAVEDDFVTISSLYTDSSGNTNIYLIPEREYIFVISKSGYVTVNSSWQPSDQIFTHIFRINIETSEPDMKSFGEIILLKGTLYENNSLMIYFYDRLDQTTNTHFIVYEFYNNTYYYQGEYNGSSDRELTIWINVDNASRTHVIVFYMNHSSLYFIKDYRTVITPYRSGSSANWLENLISGKMGNFEMGYVVMFIWYIPAFILILGLGAIEQPGLGVLSSGLWSIFITWFIEMPNEAKILTFASISIIIGMIAIILSKGKKVIQ